MNISQDPKHRPFDLLGQQVVLPEGGFEVVEPVLHVSKKVPNCDPDLMSSTLNTVPQTSSALHKTRLPFGLLIHPFKDLPELPLIQTPSIARCNRCRTYINPFVTFVDPTNWKCNVCYKNNEVPQDFNYDPVSCTYGDPHFRPEVKAATVEYVAPSEYLVRPPPAATYLYLFDVSFNAIETGYLQVACDMLLSELDSIPGDSRKRIGFMAVDSNCHFFNLSPELTQPQVFCLPDLDDMSPPMPDNLLCNMKDCREVIINLLTLLPSIFKGTDRVASALGSSLEVASKLMSSSGGRLTVFQTQLPTIGAGALKNRDGGGGNSPQSLSAVTDFYKTLALDSSAFHLGIDTFFLNSQFTDVATIACISKFTGGSVFYFPGFHVQHNPAQLTRFQGVLMRYLTRKIGFEAVMRVRCSRGLNITNFHGNCFIRSTDLLSLPNISPDSGFGLQLAIDDTLESNYVSMQAALLYTTSQGERRIRVHTLCLPVSSVHTDIHNNANQRAIIGMLSKMAVDRAINSGLSDSREAIVNAAVDMLQAYYATLPPGQRSPNHLVTPHSLKYIPLLTLALLKHMAFRTSGSGKLDDRVVAMESMKNLPLPLLILSIHPSLYPIHNLNVQEMYKKSHSPTPLDDQNNPNNPTHIILPPITPLTTTQLDRHGAYIMDCGDYLYLYLGSSISDAFCVNLLNVKSFACTMEGQIKLPPLDTDLSEYVRGVVKCLNEDRPFHAPLILIREDGKLRSLFHERFIEDKTDSSYSYQEYLQHINKEIKN